jgi:hypothetical protein
MRQHCGCNAVALLWHCGKIWVGENVLRKLITDYQTVKLSE